MSLFHWLATRKQELAVKREAKTAIELLLDQSKLKPQFLVMSALSGIVATCGIILRDQSILIAAMVLAPLLNPLLALGVGISRWHRGLMTFAMKAFGAGFVVVVCASTFISFLFDTLNVPIEAQHMLARFDVPHTLPVLLVVAFFSGFGAVYSWLRHASSGNLVGVAIAVALVPFVSAYGIFIATGLWNQLIPLSRILVSNLLLIVLGAVLAFLLLGLRLSHDDLTEELNDTA